MESGTKNSNSQASRIPIPLNLLPKKLEHLYQKKCLEPSIERSARQPLKTINYDNQMPGTSNKWIKVRNTTVHCLDTSHVTVREDENEDLDWDFKELRDGNRTERLNNKQISKTVATPTLKPHNLEPEKNIKRSLKRPNSRGLQGLSPSKKADNEQKCVRDHLQGRSKSPDFTSRLYLSCLNRNYTRHIFTYLLKSELKPLGIPKIPTKTRACLLNWVVKINGATSNPAIIETACWYLDSILTIKVVSVHKLQVIAAACYWIAQKLHGPSFTAMRLVRYSNQSFTTKQLLCTEKCILMQLNFPSQPKVPQDYIGYLAWWCDKSNPGEIEIGASFLCMAGMMVNKSFCIEYPSVIAAAAVVNALNLLGKKELLERLKISKVFKAAKEKTTIFTFNLVLQKNAVVMMRSVRFGYKSLLLAYEAPPHCIAQRIGNAIDTIRNTKDYAYVRRNIRE